VDWIASLALAMTWKAKLGREKTAPRERIVIPGRAKARARNP
jgi:hypothetical protein